MTNKTSTFVGLILALGFTTASASDSGFDHRGYRGGEGPSIIQFLYSVSKKDREADVSGMGYRSAFDSKGGSASNAAHTVNMGLMFPTSKKRGSDLFKDDDSEDWTSHRANAGKFLHAVKKSHGTRYGAMDMMPMKKMMGHAHKYVAPVPEMSTFAMMAAGLAVVGVVNLRGRRRRK